MTKITHAGLTITHDDDDRLALWVVVTRDGLRHGYKSRATAEREAEARA